MDLVNLVSLADLADLLGLVGLVGLADLVAAGAGFSDKTLDVCIAELEGISSMLVARHRLDEPSRLFLIRLIPIGLLSGLWLWAMVGYG